MEPLADRADFGRKNPIGTGAYKVVSVDTTKGIVLERNDSYVSPGSWRPPGSIARVQIVPIPDQQAAVANLMTGQIDVVANLPRDIADAISRMPNVATTTSAGPTISFIAMDAINRSGQAEPLTKRDVRRAIAMVVDRAQIGKALVDGSGATKPLNALCLRLDPDCPETVDAGLPQLDVEGAKQLMASAGYPNGFDIELNSIEASRQITEAIAGQLRKIGIRAKIANNTSVSQITKEAQGHNKCSRVSRAGGLSCSSWSDFFGARRVTIGETTSSTN